MNWNPEPRTWYSLCLLRKQPPDLMEPGARPRSKQSPSLTKPSARPGRRQEPPRDNTQGSQYDQRRAPPQIPRDLAEGPPDRPALHHKVPPPREQGRLPERRRQPRPRGRVAPGLVDVPVAAARGEDGGGELLVELDDELLLGVRADLDSGGVAVQDGFEEGVGDVVDLDLDGVDDGVKGRERVGAEPVDC